jgi:hypothetical protein
MRALLADTDLKGSDRVDMGLEMVDIDFVDTDLTGFVLVDFGRD